MNDLLMHPHNEEHLISVMTAALRAVDPQEAVRAHLVRTGSTMRVGEGEIHLDSVDRIVVVGAGKAGMPMVVALQEALGDRIADGLVTVKYGHAISGTRWHVRFESLAHSNDEPARPATSVECADSPVGQQRVRVVEAAHPIPDAAGLAAARSIRDLAKSLGPRDLLLVVLSGGASALLPLPAEGISLADLQALTDLLLRCGAEIGEINTVRKHCSQLAGGQLARWAAPARTISLVLSDVVGNPLGSIGSGPTVPDPTSFADALAVLQRYDIQSAVPASIIDHLRRGATGAVADTPKPDDPLFTRATTVVVGDNQRAAMAAVRKAREIGWQSDLLTTYLQGEAREVGKVMAALAQGIATGQSGCVAPTCFVLGGETTVTVRGGGKGGRNQELALSAAIALGRYDMPERLDVSIVSLATDGTDGPTNAAGGRATNHSVKRAIAIGLDPLEALADNNSYPLLANLGDLLVTGPTQTNVNDLVLVSALARP
jgi:hydroxypyruvate reductase